MGDISRQLGLLQRVYNFCDKHHLSRDLNDPKELMSRSLKNMALRNYLSGSEGNMINVKITFLGEHIVTGKFTPDEIKDISDIGSEIKFIS